MEELLVDLLRFMEPSLRSAEMSAPLSMLYQGTLRVLLILLHDFPEFLCGTPLHRLRFTFFLLTPPFQSTISASAT